MLEITPSTTGQASRQSGHQLFPVCGSRDAINRIITLLLDSRLTTSLSSFRELMTSKRILSKKGSDGRNANDQCRNTRETLRQQQLTKQRGGRIQQRGS